MNYDGVTVDHIRLLLVDMPALAGAKGPAVAGDGPIPAEIVIIGEAPGEEEEKRLLPFVGRAGELLDELIVRLRVSRENIYITNVVKRRPLKPNGDTRNPSVQEVKEWAPLLWKELEFVKPKYVLLLGNAALKAIHPDSRTITKARGIVRTHEKGFKTLATFHPAAVLRKQSYKPIVEEDFTTFAKVLRGEEVGLKAKHHQVVTSVEGAYKLRDRLLAAEEFAFDLETRSLDWQTEPILCVALSPQPGEAYILPLIGQHCAEIWDVTQKVEILKILQEIMASEVPKIAQNGQFDLKFLEHNGIPVNNFSFDTLIEHHLLDENLPHNLEFIAGYELGEAGHDEELRSYLPNTNITFDVVPNRVLWKYAAYDADYTMTAHQLFKARLKEELPKAYEYYQNIMIPLEKALKNMEMRGIVYDQLWATGLKKQYEEQATTLEADIIQKVGYPLNIKSTKQLRKLFFEDLGYKPTTYTASGAFSVDDTVLRQLAVGGDVIAQGVLDYREKTKRIGTFIDGLFERLGPDERIHPSYNITGTVTWRLACRNPNMQNIPDLPEMRGQFSAPEGYVVVAADYRQIELLVLAVMAGEQKMLDLYNKGTDLHKLIAAEILGIPAEAVTGRVRFIVKTIVFGLNYGRQAYSLSKVLGITQDEAQEIINVYFETFPRIRDWRVAQIQMARKQGYVESVFGFRRHLKYKGIEEREVFELDRQALNSPIQGGAAGITNTSNVTLEEMYQGKKSRSIVAMTLHDALYFYAPYTSWPEEVEQIKDVMQRPVPELGGIRPGVSVEVGWRWGDNSLLGKE